LRDALNEAGRLEDEHWDAVRKQRWYSLEGYRDKDEAEARAGLMRKLTQSVSATSGRRQVKIELEPSITEARKLVEVLSEPRCTDETLADIYWRLKDYLDRRDAIPIAPWRKVVSVDRRTSVYTFDVLECGHAYAATYKELGGR
jgi:hypothetical protein